MMHEQFIIIILGGGLAIAASKIRKWRAENVRNNSQVG